MIHHGDCLEVMAGMEPESIDAIVTDPPYGLEFMGKEWDKLGGAGFHAPKDEGRTFTNASGHMFDNLKALPRFGTAQRSQAWHQQWAEAAYRVAKPSAYLLAFGGTRTVHRMTVALEDAGWIIRDMLVWAYASGFPKSKASLKPAWEPIVMARKPGPLRMLAIDECRIEGTPHSGGAHAVSIYGGNGKYEPGPNALGNAAGRWPANVILTDPIFDGGIEGVVGGGETTTNPGTMRRDSAMGGYHGTPPRPTGTTLSEGDSGTYSRFFSIPRGPSGALSGTMGACQICGAPIADASSTTATPPPSTAPPSAVTPPSGSPDQLVFDVGSPSPSLATATAPRRVPTQPDGTPGPTEIEAKSPTGNDTSGIVTNTLPVEPPDTASFSGPSANPAGEPFDSNATTTTTPSPWLCEPCAVSVIDGSTPPPKMLSGRVLLPVEEPNYPRFYLCPKADRADREPVLGGPATTELHLNGAFAVVCAKCNRQRVNVPGAACKCDEPEWVRRSQKPRSNVHPTVKPVDLMRHLIRLVTPTGGVVLDPFLGSGTTAIAAEMEGVEWIGIEKELEYVQIAEARLNGTQRGLGLPA